MGVKFLGRKKKKEEGLRFVGGLQKKGGFDYVLLLIYQGVRNTYKVFC